MDFLQNFAVAKKAGMSKEDFVSLWESKMEIERRNAEAKLLELGANIDQALYKSSSRDSMKQPFNKETNMGNKEEITSLRAEFQNMFEAFRNEMLTMHLQLKKQMEEECRLNLDSMKVYVQNEIELLCQNRNMNNMGGPSIDLNHSISNLAINEPLLGLPFKKQSLLQKLNIPVELKPLAQETSFHLVPPSSKDYEMEKDWNEMTTSIPKPDIPIINKSYAAAAASELQDKEEVEQILRPGIENGHIESEINNFRASNETNTVEATGHIAQIISMQMAQKGTTPTSRAKQNELVLHPGVAMGKLFGTLSKHHSTSLTNMSEGVAHFKISNCSRWQASKADYYTPYQYTVPIKCKIRLQLRFSAKGFLCVNVLLSKGDYDENIRWPVRLSGWGEIYNHGSKRYTSLWNIDPQNCAKPGGTLEYSIAATVRLITSRGVHDDITFDKLKLKKYEFQDTFVFKWCVKAENDSV
uniref:MATH domain-containing protein n=2 Tax=Biomphalaria glabrata TaxID=6526 RepID=A0A2C9KC88_BIOGL